MKGKKECASPSLAPSPPLHTSALRRERALMLPFSKSVCWAGRQPQAASGTGEACWIDWASSQCWVSAALSWF